MAAAVEGRREAEGLLLGAMQQRHTAGAAWLRQNGLGGDSDDEAGAWGVPEAPRRRARSLQAPTRTSAERRRRRRRPRSEPKRKPDQSRTRRTEARSSLRAAVSRHRRRLRTIPKLPRAEGDAVGALSTSLSFQATGKKAVTPRSGHSPRVRPCRIYAGGKDFGRATERTESPCDTPPDRCTIPKKRAAAVVYAISLTTTSNLGPVASPNRKMGVSIVLGFVWLGVMFEP